MCFDSRFVTNYIAINLNIPDWIIDNWNYFLKYLQVFHFKILTWSTKTPVYDPDIVIGIANFINNFKFKIYKPFNYYEDFSLAI